MLDLSKEPGTDEGSCGGDRAAEGVVGGVEYLYTRRVRRVENWRIDLSGFGNLRRHVGRYRES